MRSLGIILLGLLPFRAVAAQPVHYKTVRVDGLNIFYREAGPTDAPTILLLHGFPSSSRMFDPLFSRLAGSFHLVAPDYPGFGLSGAPDPKIFVYTFDHLTNVVEHFTQLLGLQHYSLYVQDYGGPIGFRLTLKHPERVDALIIQNAVSHEDGLGPLWDKRRAFWKDRKSNEAALQENFLSFAAARQRHVGSDPNVDLYDPNLWTDEFAFLSRPGQAQIQTDLFFDYQNNVASYPRWQAWMKATQPPALVVWGRFDPSFQVAEVDAYRRDLPKASVYVLDAGHFALDTAADSIAAHMTTFIRTQHPTGKVKGRLK